MTRRTIELHIVALDDLQALTLQGVTHLLALRPDAADMLRELGDVRSFAATLNAPVGRCRIDGKPADVEMVTDADGNLVYTCSHDPAHRWNLVGQRL